MQVAVVTFDGFNERDSFVAAAILNEEACVERALAVVRGFLPAEPAPA